MKLQRYICKKLIDTGEHTASLLNIVKKKPKQQHHEYSFDFFIPIFHFSSRRTLWTNEVLFL